MRPGRLVAVIAVVSACAHTAPSARDPRPATESVPATASATSPANVPSIPFPPNDTTRPQPRIARARAALLTPPPADATILFDGTSLENWLDDKNAPARWTVRDGYMEVAAGTGNIHTTSSWGDVQLHIEWMAPLPPEGEGQLRGNSGVFLMNKYELQILDSYGNDTYADGHAGAIFGEYPPSANASLPPGEWQSYDVIFHRPHFDGTRLVEPARFTVIWNGVLVQDNVSLVGPTGQQRRPYTAHADRLPIGLQDHAFKVRFRNIWVRELNGAD